MSAIQQMTKKENLMFSPNNISEIINFAEYIKTSTLLPEKFINKSSDIVLGILVCLRLGLDPIMGLHQLTMLNGKLTMTTDGMLALVKSHPEYEDMIETFDEATMTATCVIKRKGCTPVVGKFSKKDAETAKLWGKKNKNKFTNEWVDSPWVTYPERMLQMRARGFAIRDGYPDATNGVLPREEVEDYQHIEEPKPVKALAKPTKTIEMPKSKPTEAAVSKMEITEPKPTQKIVETHVVIDETPLEKKLKTMEQEMKDYTNQNILKGLIEQRNVPSDLVAKWLKRENVDDVINLSDYAANKCLEYIQEHYPEHKAPVEALETPVVINDSPLEKKLKTIEEEIKDNSIQKAVKQLIEERNIPSYTVQQWLDREKVKDVMDLSHDASNKYWKHIEKYY